MWDHVSHECISQKPPTFAPLKPKTVETLQKTKQLDYQKAIFPNGFQELKTQKEKDEYSKSWTCLSMLLHAGRRLTIARKYHIPYFTMENMGRKKRNVPIPAADEEYQDPDVEDEVQFPIEEASQENAPNPENAEGDEQIDPAENGEGDDEQIDTVENGETTNQGTEIEWLNSKMSEKLKERAKFLPEKQNIHPLLRDFIEYCVTKEEFELYKNNPVDLQPDYTEIETYISNLPVVPIMEPIEREISLPHADFQPANASSAPPIITDDDPDIIDHNDASQSSPLFQNNLLQTEQEQSTNETSSNNDNAIESPTKKRRIDPTDVMVEGFSRDNQESVVPYVSSDYSAGNISGVMNFQMNNIINQGFQSDNSTNRGALQDIFNNFMNSNQITNSQLAPPVVPQYNLNQLIPGRFPLQFSMQQPVSYQQFADPRTLQMNQQYITSFTQTPGTAQHIQYQQAVIPQQQQIAPQNHANETNPNEFSEFFADIGQ